MESNEHTKIFIYTPPCYDGPKTLPATPSHEMIEYFKRCTIQINIPEGFADHFRGVTNMIEE
jgi:hypothetical protein